MRAYPFKDKYMLIPEGDLPGVPVSEQGRILGIDPLGVAQYWPNIGPFIRYSKKGNYYCTRSPQNKARIRADLGINIDDYELAQGWGDFSKSTGALAEINAGVLDGEIRLEEYKMPPLALYQHRGVLFLTIAHQVPLFADCGMGKTYMVLNAIEQKIRRGMIKKGKVLVTGKLATLHSGWAEDCAKFTDLNCEVLWLPGSGKKRKERILEKLDSGADFFVINHDGVRVFEKELAAKEFQMVVVDESTILKSFTDTSNRTKKGAFGKALMKVAHTATHRVIMTGTPAPNKADDMWGQLYFLNPLGYFAEASVHDFRTRYMDCVVYGKKNDPKAPRKWFLRADAKKDLQKIIDRSAYRLKIEDHLKDLPETTYIKRNVLLPSENTKAYRDMQKELETTIQDEKVEARIKLSALSKLRQITSGFALTETEQEERLELAFKDNPKLDLLDQLLEEEIAPEKKVVIWGNFRWEIKTIEERYKTHGIVSIYGGNSGSENVKNIDTFINDPETRIAVLHPKSAAHGITFTCAHYMVFFSLSYSAEDHYQSVARIKRASQKHPMFVYYLLAEVEGTQSIDQIIYNTVVAKTRNQSDLLDGDVTDKAIISEYLTHGNRHRHKAVP